MMNNLQVFENIEFGRLEVYEIDGKPHFPAAKCAGILGYTNPQKAIRDHCKGVNESCTPTPGGIQTIKVIPEGDLYRLIIRSNMPKAQEFERWVFDEVLPRIRQTGTYSQAPKTHAEALLQAVQLLAEQDRKLNHQQEQITVINHRINNLDSIDTTGDRRHVLAKMAQRLAHDKGVSFPAAWHLFDDAFNTAYRTNLTARRNNYAKRARIKDIGRPEYLEAVGQVEDGIRVMDKLLNGFAR
jgi:prophage antirepressor-like protein